MADADLLALTASLVAIPSVSHAEGVLTDHLEAELRALPHLEVERVGADLVARTRLGRPIRVVLAGHTDTVPVNGNAEARIDGDVLWGLGAADMKGGLAVMLALAREVTAPAVDVTFVFYAGEEVAAEHNGLGHLLHDRPDLLEGDVAILGEPTGGELEAGCRGRCGWRSPCGASGPTPLDRGWAATRSTWVPCSDWSTRSRSASP